MSASFTATPVPADNPLLDTLGIRLADLCAGQSAFEFDVEPRHLNRQGSLQGGVIATLLDAAAGYAGLQASDGVLGDAVTVTLGISYLSRVSSGRLRALGTVTRRGRSVYFASAELVTDAGTPVATAQGAFKRIIRNREA